MDWHTAPQKAPTQIDQKGHSAAVPHEAFWGLARQSGYSGIEVLTTGSGRCCCPNPPSLAILESAHLQSPQLLQARARLGARCAVRAGAGRRRAARGLLLDDQPADLRAGRRRMAVAEGAADGLGARARPRRRALGAR